MATFDLIWPRIVKVVAAVMGVGIGVWEVLADHVAHPWAFAASVMFMGLPAANSVETVVRLLATSNAPETPVIEESPLPPPPPPRRRKQR